MSHLAKKLASAFVAAGLVLGLGACGGNDVLKDQKFTGTATVQGVVMDAVTGAHLGGSDLQLFLVQGSDVRNPDRLVNDTKDPLVGEYAFNNVPTALNGVTYKVVALKNGYERFEGEFTLKTSLTSFPDSGTPTLSAPVVIADTAYTKIGNIYLFPVGTTAPNYSFTLTYNGSPVPNATALFEPTGEAETITTQTDHNDIIPATAGYLPAVSATSDANGVVTFAGSSLALGAQYTLVVPPVTFQGVQLGLLNGGTHSYYCGLGITTDIIPLNDLSQGNAYGLYVSSISNSVKGTIQADGSLVIKFSRAVVLQNLLSTTMTNGFWAVATAGTLDVTNPVNASLSSDGLTLTLTPNWTIAPAAGTPNVQITYQDDQARVSVVGYPTTSFKVFSLDDASGTQISGTVDISGP